MGDTSHSGDRGDAKRVVRFGAEALRHTQLDRLRRCFGRCRCRCSGCFGGCCRRRPPAAAASVAAHFPHDNEQPPGRAEQSRSGKLASVWQIAQSYRSLRGGLADVVTTVNSVSSIAAAVVSSRVLSPPRCSWTGLFVRRDGAGTTGNLVMAQAPTRCLMG